MLLLTLSLISQACHSNEPDELTIEKEVIAAFESLVLASRTLDSEKYFKHFSGEKFVGLNSDGSNWNALHELQPMIESGFAAVDKIESLRFTNIKVSVIDANTALLANEYEQTMRLMNGKLISSSGGGLQVWSKHSGHWLLVGVAASNK